MPKTFLVHAAGVTPNGELDKEGKIRLRKGFRKYNNFLKKGIPASQIWFILTVADRLREGYPTQAEMMKDLMIEWGLPKDQIVIRNVAHTTTEEIHFVFQTIVTLNLPRDIIDVSSWYHIPRIRLIWYLLRKKFGYPKVQFVCAGTANWRWVLKEPQKILRDRKQIDLLLTR